VPLEPSSVPPPPSSARPGHRLLVVDDDPAIVTLLERALGHRHTVSIARDGKSAIERAERPPHPDLIILDVMMPHLDGFEVAQRLRMSPSCARIPIIFLTARDAALDQMKGQSLGAHSYIAKPFRLADLLQHVERALSAAPPPPSQR